MLLSYYIMGLSLTPVCKQCFPCNSFCSINLPFIWGTNVLKSYMFLDNDPRCKIGVYLSVTVSQINYQNGSKSANFKNWAFYFFHPILMHFYKLNNSMIYWWSIIFFSYFISKRGLKEAKFRNLYVIVCTNWKWTITQTPCKFWLILY